MIVFFLYIYLRETIMLNYDDAFYKRQFFTVVKL
jgi:hypothetical protein